MGKLSVKPNGGRAGFSADSSCAKRWRIFTAPEGGWRDRASREPLEQAGGSGPQRVVSDPDGLQNVLRGVREREESRLELRRREIDAGFEASVEIAVECVAIAAPGIGEISHRAAGEVEANIDPMR